MRRVLGSLKTMLSWPGEPGELSSQYEQRQVRRDALKRGRTRLEYVG